MALTLGMRTALQTRTSPLAVRTSSAVRPRLSAPVLLKACATPVGPAGRPAVPYRPSLAQSKRIAPVATKSASSDDQPISDLGETAKANLRRAAANCKRLGWISFWAQLVLSTVSIVILLFSVAFSSTTGPSISLYLTIFGVLAGFVSTGWAFRYTRIGGNITQYLEAKEGLLPPELAKKVKKVSKTDVVASMNWGAFINLLGFGSTILGLQATVGTLVAKTLTNATANPFLAGGSGSWNPVLALDVFLVQASANTLMAHFCGIMFSLWLARSIDGNAAASNPPTPRAA